jgi:hypothetical protein
MGRKKQQVPEQSTKVINISAAESLQMMKSMSIRPHRKYIIGKESINVSIV